MTNSDIAGTLERVTPGWCGAMVAAFALRLERDRDVGGGREDLELAQALATAWPSILALISAQEAEIKGLKETHASILCETCHGSGLWRGGSCPVCEGRGGEPHPLSGLSAAQREDVVAHIRGLTGPAPTYKGPEHGWTCFHCGETFLTVEGARLHFGEDVTGRAACHGTLAALERERDKANRNACELADMCLAHAQRAEAAEAALLGKEEEIKGLEAAASDATASLQHGIEAYARLVEAGQPFLKWANVVGPDNIYLGHKSDGITVGRLRTLARALSTAVAELGSGEGSARANRDAAPISRPDSQHSDGGREP